MCFSIVTRSPIVTEAIIPNETVITSTVINQSYSDRKVAVTMPVQVSYASDLDLAMRLMVGIAQRHPRVLREPAPEVLVKGFADNGVELELAAWVEDPEQGKSKLRSEIFLSIWQEFKAHGIEIPYPQREVRVLAVPGQQQGLPTTPIFGK